MERRSPAASYPVSVFVTDLELMSLALWLIGFVVIAVVAALAYVLVARLPRGRWWLRWVCVTVIIVAGFTLVTQIDLSMKITDAFDTLERQVGFPATYVEDQSSGAVGTSADAPSSITLDADGTAVLSHVVLADAVTQNAAGRWCLEGEASAVSGAARWSVDASGVAFIESDGKVSRLFPDDSLFLGDGWRKTYLLTSCKVEYATVFYPERQK